MSILFHAKGKYGSKIMSKRKYVQPTVGDLPGIKSQLDSKLFVIGIPSGVWVRLLLKIPFLKRRAIPIDL